MAYLLHLRPMEWPIMSAHFLLGALLARGLALPWGPTLAGWFIFVVLTNGGTLAINSAFDQDEGDIGYLQQPPPPPPHLFRVSALLLGLSLLLGFLLPFGFAVPNALCVGLAWLYSVPPARLKARAGWDLLVNMAGFGALTPMAGWGLTGTFFTSPFLLVAGGFGLLFGALYPTTQIYQMDEDRARGDRTLVIRLGTPLSLTLALLLALGAHALFAQAALQHHEVLEPVSHLVVRDGIQVLRAVWQPVGGPSPAWLFLSLAAWLGVLVPWLLRWRTLSLRRQKAGMYWTLAAWAVTDVVVLVLLWPRS